MVCGRSYLLHLLTVQHVPFIFTTVKGKTFRDMFPSNIKGVNAVAFHMHKVRSQILTMVRSCLCNFSLDGIYLHIMKINENDASCEGFE